MPRVRALAVVVLLLSYGAVGARQPAVRTLAPLPAPMESFAQALSFPSPERATLLLEIVRLVFDTPDGLDAADTQRRARLQQLLQAPAPPNVDTVPLPLDPSIWRETILVKPVPDAGLVSAIFSARSTALLYHGLSALDDETLAWLGPDRETLQHLLRHAGAFATFGRSIRVKGGRVVVPGGEEAEPIWKAVVGADPAKPGSFVRRVFGDEDGRLAYFYDALAHLDERGLRFALSASLSPSVRIDRTEALFDTFKSVNAEWRPEQRPFSRPAHDPAFTLSLIAVTPDGAPVGPMERWLWEQVFRGDDTAEMAPPTVTEVDVPSRPDATLVDAAWLVSRIHRVGSVAGRRRFEALMFAQRAFNAEGEDPAATIVALRAVMAYPALLFTLERAGIRDAATMAAATARAGTLMAVADPAVRSLATRQFQSALGIVERAARSRALSAEEARERVASLSAVPLSAGGYEGRIAAWLRREFLDAATAGDNETANPLEDMVLAAMAGVTRNKPGDRLLEWEGQTYQIDVASAELNRLRRIRERQGGISLDAAFEAMHHNGGTAKPGPDAEGHFAAVLVSMLYAASLGEPEGKALAGGNVALRHDLGFVTGVSRRPSTTWRIAAEDFASRAGWHLTGSLLALDVPLAYLSMRRMDLATMPQQPRMSSNERQTTYLTVALMNPHGMTDAGRDEIAAAVARGRARLSALTADRDEVGRVVREAGLTEWRREALVWTIAHDRENLESLLSSVELMWLGAPRVTEAVALDAWGTAMFPLTGCLCVAMPRPRAWEEFTGHPSLGVLATRGADVAIRVAEAFAAMKLPATLVPAVMAFAMQQAVDEAQPSHFDDWLEFTRAARTITDEQVVDYVAALAADGPLLPAVKRDHPRP